MPGYSGTSDGTGNDEFNTPALEMQPRPTMGSELTDRRERMMRKLRQLAFLRQGHDGPEVGTRYNLPSQGG